MHTLRPPKSTASMLQMLLAIGIFCFSISGIYTILNAFTIPEDIRGFEPNVLYTLQRILLVNDGLYDYPAHPPFSISQYTPLYYMVCDAAASIAGLNPEDYVRLWIMARSISMLAFVGTLVQLFLICRYELKASTLLALAVSLPAIQFAMPWYMLARPDSFLMFFTIGCCYSTIRYLRTQHLGFLLLSSLMAWLAFISKQSGIISIGAVPLILMLRQAWKPLLQWCISLALLSLATTLFMTLTGYWSAFVFDNIYSGLKNTINVEAAMRQWYEFAIKSFPYYLILIPASILVIYRFRHFVQNPGIFVVFLFFITHLLAAHLLLLKEGSTVGYFNEATMLGILLVLVGIHAPNQPMAAKAPLISMAWMLFAVLWSYYFNQRAYQNQFEHLRSETARRYHSRNILLAEINGNDRWFYSEDKIINLMASPKAILPHNDITPSAYSQHLFDFSKLDSMLMQGKIETIVTRNGFPMQLYGLTIGKVYTLADSVGVYKLYRYPK